MESPLTTFDHIARSARSRKLCKDPANGLIFGVCAGVAWWLGIKTWVVRLLAVLSLVFFAGTTLLAYVVAALILPKRKLGRYEEVFGRCGDRWGDRGAPDYPGR